MLLEIFLCLQQNCPLYFMTKTLNTIQKSFLWILGVIIKSNTQISYEIIIDAILHLQPETDVCFLKAVMLLENKCNMLYFILYNHDYHFCI